MGTQADLDPRVGGTYRCWPGRHPGVGEFVEWCPIARWCSPSDGRARPPHPGRQHRGGDHPDAGRREDEVRLVHRGLPDDAVGDHTQGWDHYLDRLAAVAAGGASDPTSPLTPPEPRWGGRPVGRSDPRRVRAGRWGHHLRMEAKNLADRYGLPRLDWDAIEARLTEGVSQAPGTGGPDRHTCWLATSTPTAARTSPASAPSGTRIAFWFETGERSRRGGTSPGIPGAR